MQSWARTASMVPARRQLLLPVGGNHFFRFLTPPSLGEAFDSGLFSSFFSAFGGPERLAVLFDPLRE
jgi:hypothetical protein